MRTHISKSLQVRSKTIRKAVTEYNAAATALGRPSLDAIVTFLRLQGALLRSPNMLYLLLRNATLLPIRG